MLPKDVARLQLAELLDFRPDLGIIRLHDQRVVILSAAAMGLMKKELIDTFGRDVARRLMLRFGYADGYHDAVNMRDRSRGDGSPGRDPRGRRPAYARRHRPSGDRPPRTRRHRTVRHRGGLARVLSQRSSICTTTEPARSRCAGRLRDMPPATRAPAWGRKCISAKQHAWHRVRSGAPSSVATPPRGATRSNSSAPTFRVPAWLRKSSACTALFDARPRSWRSVSGSWNAANGN